MSAAAEKAILDRYEPALRSYLDGAGESALHQAYELGRDAVASGVCHLVVVSHHHASVRSILSGVQDLEARTALEGRAEAFFEEALAPFAMALRGFAEAVTSMRQLNDSLEERVARRTHELEEAVRVRDEFLSVASHELRTPMTSLSLQCQAIQRQLERETGPYPAWLPGKTSSLLRSVERLTRLTENLLDVTRIMSGKLALDLAPVDLAALVKEVMARFDDEAARAGCTLSLDAPASLVGTWDRTRLDNVLTNLLANAVKFGAGAPIEVRVEGDEQNARLIVRDRGIGIAHEALARLFGRFERAVSMRHYGGLGLGLWISRQSVEAMRGKIEVTSELGRGATFVVTLPRGTIPPASPTPGE